MRAPLLAMAFAACVIGGPVAMAADTEVGKLVHGARLYDEWWTEIKAKIAEGTHSLWPADDKDQEGEDTFRCRSCHGYDFKGRAGIKGVAGVKPEAVAAAIADPKHGMSAIAGDDLAALQLYIAKGSVDFSPYYDKDSKKAKGDAAAGKNLYETVCYGCHKADGKGVKDGDPLGVISNEAPWETMHKITYGAPGENMPALIQFGPKVAGDILAYIQTLPGE